MTMIRLACIGTGREPVAFSPSLHRINKPSILFSYFYRKSVQPILSALDILAYVVDSGAYSAWSLGKPIDLAAYIEFCKATCASAQPPEEVFALDVIGDWQASASNTLAMWRVGIPAIPCFHIGEPWDVLRGLCRDYPKVALGGVAKVRGARRVAWLTECFQLAWPKRLHGFGIGATQILKALPFHSVDSTSWEGPARSGRGPSGFRVRLGTQDAKRSTLLCLAGVDYYLGLQDKLQARWRKELALLERI